MKDFGINLYEIISTALTLFFGGGWFVNYRANKKKANAEAAQSEAEGWKVQQDVYQQTIADLKESCEYIKQDRNLLREENTKLREENTQYREKINEMENLIFELKKEVSRLGRRVDALTKEDKEQRKKTA